MAVIQKIVSWSFDSGMQNWIGRVPLAQAAYGHSAVSQSLSASVTQNNATVRNTTGSFSYTGSWANILGYTSGSNTQSRVLGISASYRWQCPKKSGTAISADGPFELRDSGFNLIGTLAGRDTFTTTTTYTYKSGSTLTTTANESFSASVVLMLTSSLGANGGSGLQTLDYQDDISVTASIEEIYTSGSSVIYRGCSGFFFP